MPIVLDSNSYGKAEVHLVKVLRDGDTHDLRDLTVTVQLQGDFAAAHVAGDNRAVLPTDTMMRTVYALASDDPLDSIEGFGLRLADHFLRAAPAASTALVGLTQHPWDRIGGRAFAGGGGGLRTATVTGARDATRVEAGIADLLVLKTSDSAFTGFLTDDFTFLEQTEDRILATVLSAGWAYASADIDYSAHWEDVRETMVRTFAEHHSRSVQHTIWVLGEAVLERFDAIERIWMSLPNKHHLPVDLAPYGRENAREVFSATDRPYGVIEATVRRG